MKKFESYLKGKGFSPTTIKGYLQRVSVFVSWLEEQELSLAKVRHNDLIRYVGLMKQRKCKVHTLNTNILGIRHFYNFLGVKRNPASGLHIKGTTRTVPHDILERDELDKVYNNMTIEEHPSYLRDKVMVGLMVFQGMTSSELADLSVGDVDLTRGTVNVKAQRTTNGRVLKLQAQQMVELYQYIHAGRHRILQIKGSESDKLFLSGGCSSSLRGISDRLITRLKKEFEFIKSFRQIRSSVITHWLKENNLRQVQYMAGHRYVSSTERYLEADLDNLKEQLGRYHPMG